MGLLPGALSPLAAPVADAGRGSGKALARLQRRRLTAVTGTTRRDSPLDALRSLLRPVVYLEASAHRLCQARGEPAKFVPLITDGRRCCRPSSSFSSSSSSSSPPLTAAAVDVVAIIIIVVIRSHSG